jgi:hypothetical protein
MSVHTRWIRRLTGGAGLLAAAWLATASAAPLPAEVTGKLIEADIAYLQKNLEKPPEKRAVGTLKSVAMLIALQAQNEMAGKDGPKMAALRDQALKVAEALAKKDFAAAKAAADGLSKPSGGAMKPVKLHEQAKFDLAELMSVFRLAKVGGLNIEKDIRDQAKKETELDVKLVGELGAHSNLVGQYALEMPAENAAANPANKKKWDGYTQDMMKLSGEVSTEAAKGAKADKAKLKSLLGKLDASCTACHNEFRD